MARSHNSDGEMNESENELTDGRFGNAADASPVDSEAKSKIENIEGWLADEREFTRELSIAVDKKFSGVEKTVANLHETVSTLAEQVRSSAIVQTALGVSATDVSVVKQTLLVDFERLRMERERQRYDFDTRQRQQNFIFNMTSLFAGTILAVAALLAYTVTNSGGASNVISNVGSFLAGIGVTCVFAICTRFKFASTPDGEVVQVEAAGGASVRGQKPLSQDDKS